MKQSALPSVFKSAAIILCLALCLCAAPSAYGQAAQPAQSRQAEANDPRLNKLPAAQRAAGLALLNESDPKKRAQQADTLGRVKEARDFLLDLLATERIASVRRAIIDRVARLPHPSLIPLLAQYATQDPDAAVAIMALERLRMQRIMEARQLLVQRLKLARSQQDEAGFRLLAQEDERWISLTNATMLPSFMRVPPPLFSLKPADQPVRVLAFGDFGNGSENQRQVARAMLKTQRQSPADFAITLGDNFYPDGMDSPADPRWKTWWDELYDPLGIRVYVTFGNHDWHAPDGSAAELLYAHRSPSWRFPAPYYTFTAGPAQFFALDTNEISEAQLLWLKEALDKSQSRWKIVYGHHPIYSVGRHGNTGQLIEDLLPILKGRADVYFAGHEHDLQHNQPDGGVHFFVAGGGGAGISARQAGPRSLFYYGNYGFSVIEADAEKLKIKLLDAEAGQLYDYTLSKPKQASQEK